MARRVPSGAKIVTRAGPRPLVWTITGTLTRTRHSDGGGWGRPLSTKTETICADVGGAASLAPSGGGDPARHAVTANATVTIKPNRDAERVPVVMFDLLYALHFERLCRHRR